MCQKMDFSVILTEDCLQPKLAAVPPRPTVGLSPWAL